MVEIAFYHLDSKTFQDSGLEPSVKTFVKTFVDVIGATLLKEMLFFSNLTFLHPMVRVILNLALVSAIFGESLKKKKKKNKKKKKGWFE